MTRELVVALARALWSVTVPPGLPSVVTGIAGALVAALTIVSTAASAELSRIVVVTRSRMVGPRVVARVIEVSRIEIHGAPLPLARTIATSQPLRIVVTNW
jgi:hypothetical protein